MGTPSYRYKTIDWQKYLDRDYARDFVGLSSRTFAFGTQITLRPADLHSAIFYLGSAQPLGFLVNVFLEAVLLDAVESAEPQHLERYERSIPFHVRVEGSPWWVLLQHQEWGARELKLLERGCTELLTRWILGFDQLTSSGAGLRVIETLRGRLNDQAGSVWEGIVAPVMTGIEQATDQAGLMMRGLEFAK